MDDLTAMLVQFMHLRGTDTIRQSTKTHITRNLVQEFQGKLHIFPDENGC